MPVITCSYDHTLAGAVQHIVSILILGNHTGDPVFIFFQLKRTGVIADVHPSFQSHFF